jgi:[CysO sulfur-carrier protein]-S-L-cysteine hydrolase
MITIQENIAKQIIAHAQRDLPNEACGYLAGKTGIIDRAFHLINIDHSPEHFSFDPAEQFQTVKQARNEGLEIIANYHSHPETPARPSIEDIRLAYDPNIFYIIISLAGPSPVIKGFKIINGVSEPIEINIIP